MTVRFYLSYDIKITSQSHFWRKKIIFYHYVRNVVWMSFHKFTKICKTLELNTWGYITPICDVML